MALELEMTMTAPKVVRAMCPMNCHPTFCGMLVEWKTVSGDKNNPDSHAAAAPTRSLAIRADCLYPRSGMIAVQMCGVA